MPALPSLTPWIQLPLQPESASSVAVQPESASSASVVAAAVPAVVPVDPPYLNSQNDCHQLSKKYNHDLYNWRCPSYHYELNTLLLNLKNNNNQLNLSLVVERFGLEINPLLLVVQCGHGSPTPYIKNLDWQTLVIELIEADRQDKTNSHTQTAFESQLWKTMMDFIEINDIKDPLPTEDLYSPHLSMTPNQLFNKLPDEIKNRDELTIVWPFELWCLYQAARYYMRDDHEYTERWVLDILKKIPKNVDFLNRYSWWYEQGSDCVKVGY
jgi:hypothetical protein